VGVGADGVSPVTAGVIGGVFGGAYSREFFLPSFSVFYVTTMVTGDSADMALAPIARPTFPRHHLRPFLKNKLPSVNHL